MMDTSNRRWLLVLAALVTLAHLPLLALQVQARWRYPHYQYVPLLLAAAAGLAWSRRSLPMPDAEPRPGPALACLLGSGLLLGVGVLFYSPWFAAVGFPLALTGLGLAWAGRGAWTRYGPVGALLWLAVPLPMGWDQRLIGWLQLQTSRISSALLDVVGVPHLMAGNVLEFPGKRFFVEEACSGVQSLFALVAATGAYLVWRRRPWPIALILLPAAVLAALLMNVLRVTSIALAHHGLGLDLSTGWPHEALGFFCFALALLLLTAVDTAASDLLGPIALPRFPRPGDPLPTDTPDPLLAPGRLLGPPGLRAFSVSEALCLGWNRWIAGVMPAPLALAAVPGSAAVVVPVESDPTPTTAPPGRGWRSALMALALGFGALALVQVPMMLALVRPWLPGYRGLPPVSARIARWDAATLPDQLRSWKQVKFERVDRMAASDLGENSTAWHYEAGNLQTVFSCDFPFGDWHELPYCYRGQGWSIERREIVADAAEPGGPAAPFVWVEMRKPTGETGLLCFALIDAEGQPVPIPETSGATQAANGTVLRSLINRIRKRWGAGRSTELPQDLTYQLQAFLALPGAIPEASRAGLRAELQAEFVTMRQTLLADLAAGGSTDPVAALAGPSPR